MYMSKTPGNGFLRCQLCGGRGLEKRAVRAAEEHSQCRSTDSAMGPHMLSQMLVPEEIKLSRYSVDQVCSASHHCLSNEHPLRRAQE